MNKQNMTDLERLHTREAIAQRIEQATNPSHLGDFVLGAVDGGVTTFAIVAGCAGANVSSGVALVLGLANVLADGLSMATGNYLAQRTELQRIDRLRRMEEMHIDEVPESEREEIRQIFERKGFEGHVLEQIVETITEDRQRWIDTMLTEEWGLSIEERAPIKAAFATFTSFLLAGMIPLIPLFFMLKSAAVDAFPLCAAMTGATFLLIGWLRGYITEQKKWVAAVETFLLGGSAAAVAYAVGALLKAYAE